MALVLLVACSVRAADRTGAVVGIVVDRSGATVPHAKVHLTRQLSEARIYDAVGNGRGAIRLTAVKPGVYTIQVKVPGFVEKTVSDVRVNAGKRTDLGKVVLDVGCDDRGVRCEEIEVGPVAANGEDARLAELRNLLAPMRKGLGGASAGSISTRKPGTSATRNTSWYVGLRRVITPRLTSAITYGRTAQRRMEKREFRTLFPGGI